MENNVTPGHRRQTRRQYSAEEKIRIVLEGLRGEESVILAGLISILLVAAPLPKTVRLLGVSLSSLQRETDEEQQLGLPI